MICCVNIEDGGGEKKKDPSYELINGQGLEPYNSMPYGISTVGFSGCESIAINNALILIGKACSLETVMTYMLQSINDGGGYGLYGLGGGTCHDIVNTLTKLNVDYSWADYSTLFNVAESTVMIVGFWTKTTIFNGRITVPSIHTVAIYYSSGNYNAYNYYNNSTKATPFTEFGTLVKAEEKFIYGFIINK